MSVEQNKELIRRLAEAYERGDLKTLEQQVAPDYVEHSLPPGVPPGWEGFKQYYEMYRRAFPGFRNKVEDIIAEGDRVVVRQTFSGTHKGELFGIAPTGKHVSIPVIDILRIEGGKVREHWSVEDTYGMMQQLGVIPAEGVSQKKAA